MTGIRQGLCSFRLHWTWWTRLAVKFRMLSMAAGCVLQGFQCFLTSFCKGAVQRRGLQKMMELALLPASLDRMVQVVYPAGRRVPRGAAQTSLRGRLRCHAAGQHAHLAQDESAVSYCKSSAVEKKPVPCVGGGGADAHLLADVSPDANR